MTVDPNWVNQRTIAVDFTSLSPHAQPLVVVRKNNIPRLKYGYLPTYDAFEADFGDQKGYLKDKDSAQEIVQDVFINLWQKKKTITSDKSIKSYLYTSVKNRCLNYIRDNKKFRSQYLDVELELEIPIEDADIFSELTVYEAIKSKRALIKSGQITVEVFVEEKVDLDSRFVSFLKDCNVEIRKLLDQKDVNRPEGYKNPNNVIIIDFKHIRLLKKPITGDETDIAAKIRFFRPSLALSIYNDLKVEFEIIKYSSDPNEVYSHIGE